VPAAVLAYAVLGLRGAARRIGVLAARCRV